MIINNANPLEDVDALLVDINALPGNYIIKLFKDTHVHVFSITTNIDFYDFYEYYFL